MLRKIPGILALISIALFITLIVLVVISGEFARASNIKMLGALFGFAIAFTGNYLLQSHCPLTKAIYKNAIGLFGILIALCNALAIFNIIDIVQYFNWIISGAIIYILLVQLQLLNWGNQTRLLAKLFSVILVLANLVLIIFFIAQWTYEELSILINIAMLTSLASFLLGLLFVKNIPIAENESNN